MVNDILVNELDRELLGKEKAPVITVG